MTNITVRKADESDAAALAALLVKVGKVHSDGRPDIYRSPLTKHDENSARKLICGKESTVFIAEDNGAAVGELICKIMTHPGDGVFRPRKWLYIDDLCVDESARGTGVAAALVKAAEDAAKQCGCSSVELNCWAFNTRAARFYEKCGYVPQKTEYEKLL